MTLKKVFSNAFNAYKKNFSKLFLPLLVLELVIFLPLLFFTMPGTANAARALLVTIMSFSETGTGTTSVFYVFAFIILALLFFSPLIVSNTVYVVDKDFCGEDVTFRQSFHFSRKNYGSMIKSYFAALTGVIPLAAIILFMLYLVPPPEGLKNFSVLQIFMIVIAVLMILLYFLGTIFVPYVVVSENESGFKALKKSFGYVYKGNFISTVGRLGLAVAMIGALMLVINLLSQLPFKELFNLYLEDPARALQEPLMITAIVVSIAALIFIALLLPFWYAFSYNTYRGALSDLGKKQASCTQPETPVE